VCGVPTSPAGERLDVLRVSHRQHESPEDARIRRPRDDDDRECSVLKAAPQNRGNDHGQDDRGESKDEIDHAHRDAVDETAEVSGEPPERAADEGSERYEQQGDRNRDPRSVDDAAEDVATQLVGSEEVCARR
jgi:hypothetical protein